MERSILSPNGQQTATVHNGTPLFPKVTASGCLLSAVCAAFLAVDGGKHFSATIEACAAYTIAGEIAAKKPNHTSWAVPNSLA